MVNIPILLMVITGMYQGIEISHPIYALIFFDLLACLFVTGYLYKNLG
jgi:hypothetical protein